MRCSSELALALAVLGAAGCVEQLPAVVVTTSLRVTLVSPEDPGAPEQRLPDEARQVTVAVTALGSDGEVDAGFDGVVSVYAHHLGSLSPELGSTPLATARVMGGQSTVIAVDLPPVFGPTFLWVEDGGGDDPTFATGTSPTLWFRDPYVSDVQRPIDEMALDALERSGLEEKQVTVSASRYGARGRLVTTGIYAQGYTMSDVECADADGTPPCTTGDYDSIFVFSFNRARDESGQSVALGHTVRRLAGSIGEFNGLTEVNFPQTFLTTAAPDLSLLPEPTVIDPVWLSTRIPMERVEGGLVAIVDGVLCPLDEEYEVYSQWKLDVGLGCRNPINVISKGQVDFDPTDHVGDTLPRVVGTLRPVNIGSFNVWIIYPRFAADITL